MTSELTKALALAALGYHVHPCRPEPETYQDAKGNLRTMGAKTGRTINGHLDATDDPDQIAKWWRRWPDSLVGVAAGASGLVCADIDLDPAKDINGHEALSTAGLLPLPDAFSYQTRRGGTHYIYPAPKGIELDGQANLLGMRGVDRRGGSSYFIWWGDEVPAKRKQINGDPPLWLIVPAIAKAANHATSNASVGQWLQRVRDGKPSKATRRAVEAIDFPEGGAHDFMLEAVKTLVKAGQQGEPVASLIEQTRDRYLNGNADRDRAWDNAFEGSVKLFGMPAATLPMSKPMRKAIAERNTPEAKEAKAVERKAEFRAGKALERVGPGAAIQVGHRDLTDASLAEELAANLDGIWANASGVGLLRYNGVIWEQVDESLLIETVRKRIRHIRADETAAAILRGGDKRHEDEARAIESRNRIVAIARLAAGIMLERSPALDADPDVLNTPSGVVDLRTGATRERLATDYFTKVTACDYVPGITSADWRLALKALPKLTRGWVQVRLGQASSGRISQDKSIPFFVGGGDNGKSVVVGAVRKALGDYAVTVPERLLLGSDNDHPTDIMTLEGARLAVFEELPRGGRLNAQRIKLLAGTNKLSGRRMRMDFREFTATHTLAGATNHLPVITDVDDAIWARMAPVPFPFKFVSGKPRKGSNERRGDEGLRDRLADRADPAVLAWLVEGAIESYRHTPPKPPAVLAALEEWRGEADPVLGFVRDHLQLDDGSVIIASELYASFARYLEDRGQQRWSDQLIATSFTGHSSLPGVTKQQVRLGGKLMPSRPVNVLHKTIPPRAMSWVGVKFRTVAPGIKSEAELDAEALADLDSRASR